MGRAVRASIIHASRLEIEHCLAGPDIDGNRDVVVHIPPLTVDPLKAARVSHPYVDGLAGFQLSRDPLETIGERYVAAGFYMAVPKFDPQRPVKLSEKVGVVFPVCVGSSVLERRNQ